jgi:hypothetical protein
MTLTLEIASSLEAIACALQDGPRSIRPPDRLIRAVERVRRQFDKGQTAIVSEDRVTKAIEALADKGAEALRSGQRFVVAHALAQAPPLLKGHALLNTRFAGDLLGKWERDAGNGKLRPSHWRGLFHSYLQTEPSENLTRLRRLLKSALPKLIRDLKVHPRWLHTAQKHSEILSQEPCAKYAREILDGDKSSLDDLRQEIAIPDGSWFWGSLVGAFTQQLDSFDDSQFRDRIDLALSMARELRSHRNALLITVLNRFVRCHTTQRHTQLLTFALDTWRSPQLTSSVLWTQVRPEAKQMVCAWLAEQDLRDFYELCQGDKQVDEERLKYWLRFKNQITFSQIVLGASLRDSRDPDASEFRRRQKGRLALLTGSTSNNNAMLMQVGSWLFVEFSEKGNACYGYRMDRLPFETGAQRYAVTDLRSPSTIDRLKGCRLIHRGQWQEEVFDPELRTRGIRPDPVDSIAVLPGRLLGEIKRGGGEIVDRRPMGGCLVIRLPRSDSEVDRELRKLGFQWSRETGYWIE